MNISILTRTHLYRFDCLKIILNILINQTCKNIKEWVLIEGSKLNEEIIYNKQLIVEFIKNNNVNFDIIYKTNIDIEKYESDINIIMDDDDFYTNNFIMDLINKLNTIDMIYLKNIYAYDIILNNLFEINYNNFLIAYKKNPNTSIQYNNNINYVKIIHHNNTYIKRDKIILANLIKIDNYNKLNGTLSYDIINQYKNIFAKNNYLEYDIVYMTGCGGITWSPTDKSLGGSEQAIVHLSENFVNNLNKKVIVYGNFTEGTIIYNGVIYDYWYNFPFAKKIKNLILWRTTGIQLMLYFNFYADTIILDFHDNFIYTLVQLDQKLLFNFFNKISFFYFKSIYHKNCFNDYINSSPYKTIINNILENGILKNKYYKIIMNGVRINEFSINKYNMIRNNYRMCYTSCYTRGLENILENIFPYIYKLEPKSELHIYYGMKYVDNDFKNRINKLLSQPGVMDHDRQSYDLIIREKYCSTFNLYLNASPAEIDCIAVRESLVCGCIPIIYNYGVFNERDGIKYDININYQIIAKDIVNKMNNPELLEYIRKELKHSVTIIDWLDTAKLWGTNC